MPSYAIWTLCRRSLKLLRLGKLHQKLHKKDTQENVHNEKVFKKVIAFSVFAVTYYVDHHLGGHVSVEIAKAANDNKNRGRLKL